MRVLLIIPAFNEAANLPEVLRGIAEHAPGCDVCVVDDASTDGTSSVALASGVEVLRGCVNLGIGGAVQTGYLWARHHGYDVAVQIDGDGQHDPRYLAAVIAPVLRGDADLVIGSRFAAPADASGFRSTALRRAGIRYLARFLRLRCGARVTDPTSGFRAAGRRAIELFATTYPSDYPEPESIAVAVRSGLRVSEVPVVMRPRQQGRSSIGALSTLYYLVKVSLALLLLPRRMSPPLSRTGGGAAS